MIRKTVSGIMLTLLLISMLTLAFDIKPVKASGTIYIRTDGSVDPATAPIQREGNIYTFTDNIYDSIVVERSNVIIDGNGYTLQGFGSGYGFTLSDINNVTIKNTNISGFEFGVYLNSTSYNVIFRNNITANVWTGLELRSSDGNTIYENVLAYSRNGMVLIGSNGNRILDNHITQNKYGIFSNFGFGNLIAENNIENNVNINIQFWFLSDNNTIFDNKIANSRYGISQRRCGNNTIYRNYIINNTYFGLYMEEQHYECTIFHNNFIDNGVQVATYASTNIWDDGYPSGGNYWSDYTGMDEYSGPYQNETGSDGIGDIPYIIVENNQDNYPLINQWPPPGLAVTNVVSSKSVVFQNYSMPIIVTVANRGNNTENFNLTVYANTTLIQTRNVTLTSGNSTTLTFTWNTTGFDKGNHTISAVATPVPSETYTADNIFVDRWVIVAIVGDVSGPEGWPDGKVNIMDLTAIAKIYGVNYPDPRYNANYDLNDDGKINIADLTKAAKHFGETDP